MKNGNFPSKHVCSALYIQWMKLQMILKFWKDKLLEVQYIVVFYVLKVTFILCSQWGSVLYSWRCQSSY